jgi:ABC-type Mn2+/Zn2+ transport system ATPase subunit
LENFELPLEGLSSALLIGNNGSGKSTVGSALKILQKISRGTNRLVDLMQPSDLGHIRSDAPVHFEIELELDGSIYLYTIGFELPK